MYWLHLAVRLGKTLWHLPLQFLHTLIFPCTAKLLEGGSLKRPWVFAKSRLPRSKVWQHGGMLELFTCNSAHFGAMLIIMKNLLQCCLEFSVVTSVRNGSMCDTVEECPSSDCAIHSFFFGSPTHKQGAAPASLVVQWERATASMPWLISGDLDVTKSTMMQSCQPYITPYVGCISDSNSHVHYISFQCRLLAMAGKLQNSATWQRKLCFVWHYTRK